MYGRYWDKDRLPADLRSVVIETAEDLRDCLAELVKQYPSFNWSENSDPEGEVGRSA